MSLYGRVFAALYDRIMEGPEKAMPRGQRETLLRAVSGRVQAIRDAGFAVGEVVHERLRKAPPIVRPLIIGAGERG